MSPRVIPPETDRRRAIPGVDRVLARPWCAELVDRHGRPWVAARVRGLLAAMRTGGLPVPESDAALRDLIRDDAARAAAPGLRRVVNATGVVLHTNLGRAPLAAAARRAMAGAAGYGAVEFDLAEGRRGSRYDHCSRLLAELTGAEDGLAVNNGAGALALAVAALAANRSVVVSHGELVEIGGGFRVPEVVEAAGARLVPVGTTNKTRLEDYARALDGGGAGAILKVHRSNFRVSGFAEETPVDRLAALGARTGVPVVHDVGTGLLADPAALGLQDEPTPAASVAAGAHLVVFSGDKLLGGPQAGLLVGEAAHVARAKAHPLCRALRCDKAALAGLEATLALYRDPERALREVPVLRMLATPEAVLRRRVDELLERVAAAGDDFAASASVVAGESVVGGGACPGVRLPTPLLSLEAGGRLDEHLARLRAHDPPVVARGRRGCLLVDLRTVAPGEDAVVASALAGLSGGGPDGGGRADREERTDGKECAERSVPAADAATESRFQGCRASGEEAAW